MMTIDGKEVEYRAGQTILEAATGAGIYIPTLCNHPHLPNFGACRMCLVKVEKMRGFPPACTTPAADGMVVTTGDDELQALRRGVMELILSEHPNSCIVCNDREMCEKYNICPTKAGRVTGCSLCPAKEYCEIRQVVEYLGIDQVGQPFTYKDLALEREDPFFDRDYNLCILCGRCVRVCDEIRGVGAIAFTNRGHETKIGTAFGMSHLDGGCQFCGACVDVCPTGALSDKATKWHGEPETAEPTACNLCGAGCQLILEGRWDKVMAARPDVEGHNRGQACVLGRFCIPALFNGADRLQYPMVRKLGELVPVNWDEALEAAAEGLKKHSASGVAFLAAPQLTNEAGYVLSKLAAAGQNAFLDIASHFDSIALRTMKEITGEARSPGRLDDIREAEAILLVGADVCVTHPVLTVHINAAKSKGAKVLRVGPGKEVNAGLVDHAEPGDDFAGPLAGLVRALGGPDCGSGSASDALVDAIKGKKVAVIVGPNVLNGPPKTIIKTAWNVSKLTGGPLVLLLQGNSQGLALVGALAEGGNDYQSPGAPKAVYTTSGTAQVPDGAEFLVVQDIYPSELSKKADVILPVRGLPEVDGTITSMEGRTLVLKPVAKGPSRALADWNVLLRLGHLLGVELSHGREDEITRAVNSDTPIKGLGLLPPVEGGEPVPIEPGEAAGEYKDEAFTYRGASIPDKVRDLHVLLRYRGVIE